MCVCVCVTRTKEWSDKRERETTKMSSVKQEVDVCVHVDG